jgi:ribonuclease HI
MKKATLYTDGGARGNPGPAGIGAVLTMQGQQPISCSEYIGETTNNQAEYRALLQGLELAQKQGVTHLACFLDSELIVKQLRGEYRVKHPELKPIYDSVVALAKVFDAVSYEHVPRAKNKLADKLVNEAIDAASA